jgi:hypothetical protein
LLQELHPGLDEHLLGYMAPNLGGPAHELVFYLDDWWLVFGKGSIKIRLTLLMSLQSVLWFHTLNRFASDTFDLDNLLDLVVYIHFTPWDRSGKKCTNYHNWQ